MTMDIDYRIIVDTREKENKHIINAFKKNNIPYIEKGLVVGDYRIEAATGYTPNITIDRKASLNELIANLLDKEKDVNGYNRFFRELERAHKSNTKVILLIEDKDYYLNLLRGKYISHVKPKAITGMVISLMAKYPNLSIMATDRLTSGSLIQKLLYYHLRQDLKNDELFKKAT